jgi:hypothetical protein
MPRSIGQIYLSFLIFYFIRLRWIDVINKMTHFLSLLWSRVLDYAGDMTLRRILHCDFFVGINVMLRTQCKFPKEHWHQMAVLLS